MTTTAMTGPTTNQARSASTGVVRQEIATVCASAATLVRSMGGEATPNARRMDASASSSRKRLSNFQARHGGERANDSHGG